MTYASTARRPHRRSLRLAALVAVLAALLAHTPQALAQPPDGPVILAYGSQDGMSASTYEHVVYNPVTDRLVYMYNTNRIALRNPVDLVESQSITAAYSGSSTPGQLVADPVSGRVFQSTRRSQGRLNVLLPQPDGTTVLQRLGADGLNLPLPASSAVRMALDPASGALYIATQTGTSVTRVALVGDDPAVASSWSVATLTGSAGVHDFAFVAPATAVAALNSPSGGSYFAVLTFGESTTTVTPIEWTPGAAQARVAAAGGGSVYLISGAAVQRFHVTGAAATPVEPLVTLPYPATSVSGVVADPATGALFVGTSNRNVIRVDEVRSGTVTGTVVHPRIGAGTTKVALDGRGGAIAVNDGVMIRVGRGTPASPPPPVEPQTVVIDDGHLDVAVILLHDGPELYIKDGTQSGLPRWHPLEKAVLHLKPLESARAVVGDNPFFAPFWQHLGPPGTPIWRATENNTPGLVWPGWSTEQLYADVDTPTTIRLTGYSGPGNFAISSIGSDFNLVVSLSGSDPSLPYVLPAASHAHNQWSFTEDGVYRLTLTANATTRWGEPLEVTRTLAFAVGNVDPTTVDPGPGGDDALSQSISASIDPSAGALVVTVDPDDRHVVMGALEMGAGGDRWVSQGVLRPVTVTDTRAAKPGWSVSGQVSAFTSGADSFEGRYLGWAPSVTSQADGQGVAPGAVVAPGFPSGNGIASGATLGSASTGSGLGTAVLGAGLSLELPTTVPAGTYTALLTLTAI